MLEISGFLHKNRHLERFSCLPLQIRSHLKTSFPLILSFFEALVPNSGNSQIPSTAPCLHADTRLFYAERTASEGQLGIEVKKAPKRVSLHRLRTCLTGIQFAAPFRVAGQEASGLWLLPSTHGLVTGVSQKASALGGQSSHSPCSCERKEVAK